MTGVLVGIDAGTTRIKAAAFSPDGREIHRAAVSNEVLTPRPAWREQDMAATWRRCRAAVGEVVSALDAETDVLAVGVTGQGDGCWLLDDDRDPVRNAVLWNDGRARDYVRRWRETGTADALRDICGSELFPGVSLVVLCWLSDNEPSALERASTVLFCKDWLGYKLTGTVNTDFSDASLPYLDVETRTYADDVGELVGLSTLPDLQPPIVPGADVAGTVDETAAAATGLPAGTPVVSGVNDVAASAFGSGVATVGESSSVLGTTALNQTLIDSPSAEFPGSGTTTVLGVDGLASRAMASMAGTTNLDWAVDEFADTDDYEAIERRIRKLPPGSEGLLYHPYLSAAGERAPFLAPGARAMFTGLAPDHTSDHFLRAVYEGITLAVRDCYEHIPSTGGATYVSGGGTQSAFWRQLLADGLGEVVRVPAASEPGAKGAALLAGMGVDVYGSLADATDRATSVDRSHDPDPERAALYDDLYKLYAETYRAMFDVWRLRHEYFSGGGDTP
jgi:sugar (pentulose or hexulose) kinase